nr:RNA-directed DNA polymerase, eukaryota, reverse transcriptase zinc-binding domain protein [Tanacetum cinerariifolium]
MDKNIAELSEFGYHFGCKELKLSHMCFGDDLLVLCKGNKGSTEVFKKALDEFSQISGLVPNLGKSIIFFGSIKERDQIDLLQAMPFKCGKLPIRYLGVPLMAKRLGGHQDEATVADIINDGQWMWHDGWMNKSAEVIANIIHDNVRRKLMTIRRVVKDETSWPNNALPKEDRMDIIERYSKGKCIGMVVNKPILASTVYFIWQERNLRLFKGESKSAEVTVKIIHDNVRRKLMTIRRVVKDETSWSNNALPKEDRMDIIKGECFLASDVSWLVMSDPLYFLIIYSEI